MRLTLADEKLWKGNVIMTDPLHYRRGNYRGARFNPGERRDNGSTSEDVHPHLLIREPIVHLSDLSIEAYVFRGRALMPATAASGSGRRRGPGTRQHCEHG